MKAPRFTYHDPLRLKEAVGLLAEFGDEAKVLAGGQSLIPTLNFRLARPQHLVDINRIEELGTFSDTDGYLSIGATVRQRALERSPLVQQHFPLIAQALRFIGHPQIRNRGTVCGSVAHADPAAELPAVMVALDAEMVVRKGDAERSVKASDFFISPLLTVLEPDELLIRIIVPALPTRIGSSVQEVAMRAGDFALGGVAITLTLGENCRISQARIACFGVDDRPMRIQDAEDSLVGQQPSEDAFAAAGRIVSERVDPSSDIHASASYRRRLVGTLTRRGLAAAFARTYEATAQ